MPITTAVCATYKKECMEGVHVLADTYKMALLKPSTTGALGASTTNYSELGADEVSAGLGYTTGGATLTGAATSLSGTTALLDFADVVWGTATFSAGGAVIYNSSKANRAVAVLSFGGTYTGSGANFTVPMTNTVQGA